MQIAAKQKRLSSGLADGRMPSVAVASLHWLRKAEEQ